jgi:hypothetical protein
MIKLALHLSIAYIEQNGGHATRSVPALTNSLLIMALALAFLCCLHIVLVVLWARHSLNHHYFNLTKVGIAAQAIAVISQICAVVALGLFSYSLQRIAADKFIRQGERRASWRSGCQTPADIVKLAEQTVQGV